MISSSRENTRRAGKPQSNRRLPNKTGRAMMGSNYSGGVHENMVCMYAVSPSACTNCLLLHAPIQPNATPHMYPGCVWLGVWVACVCNHHQQVFLRGCRWDRPTHRRICGGLWNSLLPSKHMPAVCIILRWPCLHDSVVRQVVACQPNAPLGPRHL